jgi:hypothetical protein
MLHRTISIRAVTVVTPPYLAPLWCEYRNTVGSISIINSVVRKQHKPETESGDGVTTEDQAIDRALLGQGA